MMEWIIKEFWLVILVYCMCFLLVFLAIIGDLISGVRKAIKAGKDRLSVGYLRTIDKLCKYYNSLFSVSIVDCFLMMIVYVFQTKGWLASFPVFPIATVLMGGYLAFVEVRSVFEKLEDKEKARAEKDLSVLIKMLDKENIEKVVTILKEVKK